MEAYVEEGEEGEGEWEEMGSENGAESNDEEEKSIGRRWGAAWVKGEEGGSCGGCGKERTRRGGRVWDLGVDSRGCYLI